MTPTTLAIDLGADLADYAQRKVASGEFGSIADVVRDAMRRAEARDAQAEQLRQAIQEGLDSGPAEPFDWEAFMERKFGPHDAA